MGEVKWFSAPLRMMFWMFCWSFSMALGAPTPSNLTDIVRLWSHTGLYCGREGLKFILPASQMEIISLMSMLDSEGQFHPLKNSTCGVSISQKHDGSTVVTAPYAGCFFIRKNGNFLMTFRIERQDAVGKVLAYEQELNCPIQLPALALDAPSSSVCQDVQRQDRIPCATQSVSQRECERKGCCYTPGDLHAACYYGNTVTAQCTPDGHFSIAVSRDVTLPSLILESMRLVSGHGSGCVPVTKNNAFALYKFPLSACGTTFQVAGGQGVYANELIAYQDVQNWNTGSITRDSMFRLYISCSYSTGDYLPLEVKVFTLPPPPSVTQYGPLNLELRIATDQLYSEYYANRDYPVVKVLRDPVFLEVRILQRTDPNLVLVLHECWATSSTNPLQKPQWSILVNRCPYGGDNYQTRFVTVEAASGLQFPSHYLRFVVSTFTFVDSASRQALTGPVYFHCSASACVPSAQESCMARCLGVRARRTPENQTPEDTPRSLVTAEGAVDFQISKAQTEQKVPHWSDPILSEEWERALVVAVGVVFVALIFVGIRKYWKRTKCEQANLQ
ncbi:zona pellucida sperm-binding protein 4-like [Hemicordylus capensis]|uniref:zona pellucida sperm-binding protein 4-like n=1 Tax=Hemicordylus capensis TaxID=884348 RepID=UPI00230441CD|nr:zona pellucida sperm-binding protein 4-like [Hemicordylus capensis]